MRGKLQALMTSAITLGKTTEKRTYILGTGYLAIRAMLSRWPVEIYFFAKRRRKPAATPTNPLPKSSMLAGSGTS